MIVSAKPFVARNGFKNPGRPGLTITPGRATFSFSGQSGQPLDILPRNCRETPQNPLGTGAAICPGMKTKYGDTFKLVTPAGTIIDAQIVSMGRWDRPRVLLPTWQQERYLNELFADGWRVAGLEHQNVNHQ